MTFDTLGLTPELLRAVAAQGYTDPTPVQAQAIPLVLAGRDVLAAAQTGTGKTAAFVLPILQLLTGDPGNHRSGVPPRHVRALVLTPTRELALQVEESVRTYGAQRPVRSTTIYGGVGFEPQARALRAGPHIVVATPGRLLDHLGQHTLDLGRVEILVLDEADRMLDMGFIRDIRRILALLPLRRQNLMFSATFSDEIRSLASGILHDPASIQVSVRNTAPELVSQLVHPVDRERKRELLSHLIRGGRIDQALVFTRTKHGANRLSEQLGRDGILASAIHGNKSQSQRVRALDDFKRGRVAILVATDLAARGLDIDALPHVVNYELPMVPEDYVHRIGRTGRAGVDGEAISLVCVDEAPLLRGIENLLRRPIPSATISGFEPDRSIPAEPIRQRSAGGARPGAPRSGFQGRPAGSGGWSGPVGRPGIAPGIGRPGIAPGIGRPPAGATGRGRPPTGATGVGRPAPGPSGIGRPGLGAPAAWRSGGGRPAGRRDGPSGGSIGQGPRPQMRPDDRKTQGQGHVPATRRFVALPGERLSRGGGQEPGPGSRSR